MTEDFIHYNGLNISVLTEAFILQYSSNSNDKYSNAKSMYALIHSVVPCYTKPPFCGIVTILERVGGGKPGYYEK